MTLLRYVDERDTDAAAALLRAYFSAEQPFTGSRFDPFGGGGDRVDKNRITSSDLVAVSMLGVDVPPRATMALIENESLAARVATELARFDPGLRFATVEPSVLATGGDASALWTLVHTSAPGMGRTKTSKLLARKRPHLFPVWDSVIHEATGQGTGTYWTWLRARFDDPSLPVWLRAVAADVGHLDDISDIRLFDVIVWMTHWTDRRSRRVP